MPNEIISPWRITLGALTLLDFGDGMKDEGRGVWDIVNDVSAPLRSDFKVNWRGLNAQNRLKISRIQYFDSDLDAREARFAFLAALPEGTPLDCLVQEENSAQSWTLAQALIQPGLEHWTESEAFYYELEIAYGVVQINPVPGIPQIDGGVFNGDAYSLQAGWPLDGGNFADRQQEPAYALDGGAFA
jgi:hypothetical protein